MQPLSWTRIKKNKSLAEIVFLFIPMLLFSSLISFVLTIVFFNVAALLDNPKNPIYIDWLLNNSKLLDSTYSLELQNNMIVCFIFFLIIIFILISYIMIEPSYENKLSVNELLTDLKGLYYFKITELSDTEVILINLSQSNNSSTHTYDQLENNFKPLIINPGDLFTSTRPELINSPYPFKVLAIKPNTIALISSNTGLDFEIPYSTFYKEFNPLIRK